MNENLRNRLEDQLEYGFPFKISEYLSEGWDIYKTKAPSFFAFFFISGLIGLFANIIPIIGPIAVSIVVSPALVAGYYIVSHRIKNGQYEGFGDFFKGFDYVGPLAIMTLLFMLIFSLAFSPTLFAVASTGIFQWYAELLGNPMDVEILEDFPEMGSNIGWIVLVNAIPVIYLAISYLYTRPLIVFHKMGAWEAMETSRKLVAKNWWSVFLLTLSFYGIGFLLLLPGIILAAISPGLGAFVMVLGGFTMVFILPAIYCVYYASFADITKLNVDEGSEDNIINHLVD